MATGSGDRSSTRANARSRLGHLVAAPDRLLDGLTVFQHPSMIMDVLLDEGRKPHHVVQDIAELMSESANDRRRAFHAPGKDRSLIRDLAGP